MHACLLFNSSNSYVSRRFILFTDIFSFNLCTCGIGTLTILLMEKLRQREQLPQGHLIPGWPSRDELGLLDARAASSEPLFHNGLGQSSEINAIDRPLPEEDLA